MGFDVTLQADEDQASISLKSGDDQKVALSKLGEVFSADWKQRLIRSGQAWAVHVGGITTGADIVGVVGGGNGTTIDTDQPELVIGVPLGYDLIPMETHVSAYFHPITDKAINNILLFGDRTQSPVSQTATGVAVTPVNLLDGAGAFPGTAWKQATADITTDPVASEILDYVATQTLAATGGPGQGGLKMDYMPEAPTIFRGPCQVVLCWGTTQASGATGMGVIKVGCVPSGYFPVG
ncbi:hypothetical protein LCGC14_0370360 [marine sediment metagenome]|uniref:Uncharacterized protein n=1 Tax=marine sediment metagenome TaxID=412755 RepID=A0A0F9TNN6_9ZZZZ